MDSLERITTMRFLFSMTHAMWAVEVIKGTFLCKFCASSLQQNIWLPRISHTGIKESSPIIFYVSCFDINAYRISE